MNNELDFYNFIQELSNVTRFGSNKALHTNVSSHIFGTLFIAYDLIKKYDLKLDKNHVFELLLFHDIVEAGMEFDIEAPNADKDKKLENYKHKIELSKIESISKKWNKPYIRDYFIEFEDMKTPEAKFAKFVDGVEARTHILYNKCKGFECAGDFDYAINKLLVPVDDFPELKPFADEIIRELERYKNKLD